MMSDTYEKDLAAMNLAARVAREHEPVPTGCSCGTQPFSDVDMRWHLISVAIRAALDEQEKTR